ncbi:MAG: type II secretion system secretin GspD, partial [Deltaproteobacteria bacterium]|nr:type II secretion system secretin GspD [Deltaproteobacteria bacterium]
MKLRRWAVIIVVAVWGCFATMAWAADNTSLPPQANDRIEDIPLVETVPPALQDENPPAPAESNGAAAPSAEAPVAPPAPAAAPAPLVAPAPATPSAPGRAVPAPRRAPGSRAPALPVQGAAPSVPAAAPAVPPAVPAPRLVPATAGGFLVKFNNADVYEVIHTLGRIAGINYLIDPRVRGTVNVHTQGTVRKGEALELLFSILRVNGATAVREGDLYHIVPMAEAKMEPMVEGGKEEPFSPNRPTMRAFPLQYIAAAEMSKVIRPFLSTGGDATEVPRANMLLVTDTAGNMEKHARLVELFDADAFKSAGVRLFPLKFLDPDEMAKSLDAIFGALDFGTKGGRPAGINFVSLSRLNALLVVSASPKTMEDVDRWIKELDREPSGASRTVRLYRVRHGKVKDISAILEKLYPARAASLPAKATEFKPQVAEPVKPYLLSSPSGSAAPAAAPKSSAPAGPEKKEGEGYDIIPDEPTNSLIIRGSASEYAAILETLKAIDVYPRQVLLEVLVGEVQLDDTLKLGIDWTYANKIGDLSATATMVTSLASATSGLKYVVDKTNRVTAAFRALASDGKVSILSSPSVIAANGRKSKIQVADSVPITTASIVANSNPPVTTQTVEYRDVGVILTFTPYINDRGLVTLEIEQEVSEVSTTEATSTTNPSFFKRNIQTTLIAMEDQSIVLGGLVKERKSLNREGVPFFYKIPLIGWIFGARSDIMTRN